MGRLSGVEPKPRPRWWSGRVPLDHPGGPDASVISVIFAGEYDFWTIAEPWHFTYSDDQLTK